VTAARLVWITPDAERMIGYCARVSSPANQDKDPTRLMKYCIKHGHWSPFEMANMCVEIKTTMSIGEQILRHRSFSFQKFSLRYAEAPTWSMVKARRQDVTNRQNSIDDLPTEIQEWWATGQQYLAELAFTFYQTALANGVAKEVARFVLPAATDTTMYMNGTIRSWIHYLDLRTLESTQAEHREVAFAIKDIFTLNLPNIAEAVWGETT
jgi:thymidylate synthase (FAD)